MINEKPFDCVRLMRELRDRVTRELDGLTFEEQRRRMHEQITAAQKQSPPSVPAGKTSPAGKTRKTA
jgi:hypothetical protein